MCTMLHLAGGVAVPISEATVVHHALQPKHTRPLSPPSLAGAIAALPLLPDDRKDLGALHLVFDRPPPQAWQARLPEGSEAKLLLLAGDSMEVPLARCTYVGLGIAGKQLAVPGCVKVRLEELYATAKQLACYDSFELWRQNRTELWLPYGAGRLLKLDDNVDQPQQQPQQEPPAVSQLQHQPAHSQLQAAHAVSTPGAQPQQQQQQQLRVQPAAYGTW
jgi:hypothetical protein